MSRLRIVLIAAAVAALSLASTCKGSTVPIPPASGDKPPELRLTNFVVGGSATVAPAEVTSAGGPTASATVGPSGRTCEIPRLMFMGSASNPIGGVKYLRVTVTHPPSATPIYLVETTYVPEADGKVATSIPLLGTNGSGGAGDKPLQVTFEGGKRGCPTPDTFVVTMNARNFNDQESTLTETLTAPTLSSAGCICE